MVFQKLKADSLQLSKGVGAENGNWQSYVDKNLSDFTKWV